MAYERTIERVRRELDRARDELLKWCDIAPNLRTQQPLDGGWSIDEILEHLALTNSFLLKTVRKHAAKADRRAARGDPIPEGESDLARLERVGILRSFHWDHPAHMTPTGSTPIEKVRTCLEAQFAECRDLLRRWDDGRGALARIRIDVDEIGRADLYEWLYFLARHSHRHLHQLQARL